MERLNLLFFNLFFILLYNGAFSKTKYLSKVVIDPSNVSLVIGEQFTSKKKSKQNYKIHIVTIVPNDIISDYSLAINSVYCYALQYNYNYKLLNSNKEKEYTKNCRQDDFMYQRHCILLNYITMRTNHSDIILFLDADMAVINPNQLIENFMQKKNEEILFYERMYNHEIMAGSYFIKNNAYGLKFLRNWSNYDFQKPNSFDGSDNVGLHNVFIDMFVTKNVTREYNKCKELWKRSKNFNDLRIYVACLRVIINNNSEKIVDDKNLNAFEIDAYSYDNGKVKVVKKLSKQKWARDIWLEASKWSSQDFFLHDVKLKNLNSSNFRTWISPWRHLFFNISKCQDDDYHENWIYNTELVKREML